MIKVKILYYGTIISKKQKRPRKNKKKVVTEKKFSIYHRAQNTRTKKTKGNRYFLTEEFIKDITFPKKEVIFYRLLNQAESSIKKSNLAPKEKGEAFKSILNELRKQEFFTSEKKNFELFKKHRQLKSTSDYSFLKTSINNYFDFNLFSGLTALNLTAVFDPETFKTLNLEDLKIHQGGKK